MTTADLERMEDVLANGYSRNFETFDGCIDLKGQNHGSFSYGDVLIKKLREGFRINSFGTKKVLLKEGEVLPSLRQFVDLLKILREGEVYDGNHRKVESEEVAKMWEDFVNFGSDWRVDYLGDEFVEVDDGLNIVYDGLDRRVEEKVENCLMEDRGIDLNDWLDRATRQGLPPVDCKEGGLMYFYPRKDRTVRFERGEGLGVLRCNGRPTYSKVSAGARGVRKRF